MWPRTLSLLQVPAPCTAPLSTLAPQAGTQALLTQHTHTHTHTHTHAHRALPAHPSLQLSPEQHTCRKEKGHSFDPEQGIVLPLEE